MAGLRNATVVFNHGRYGPSLDREKDVTRTGLSVKGGNARA